MKINLFIAFHLQIDGQTKKINHVLEKYLHYIINYHQDDLVELLPFAKFTYNNTKHASIHHTPFFAYYAWHPKFYTFHIKNNVSNLSVENFAIQMQTLHEEIISYLEKAEDKYKNNANKGLKESPSFKVGDKVWLIGCHIPYQWSSDKLDQKWLGPFIIIKKIIRVAFKINFLAI